MLKKQNRSLRHVLLALTVAFPILGAGCASGAPDATSGPAPRAVVASPLAGCGGGVAGQLDAAQLALFSALVPTLAGVPGAGAPAQDLVRSVIRLLDVGDALANGLQALALTQDPAAINQAVAASVATLSCFLQRSSIGLLAAAETVPGGAIAVPGLATLFARMELLNTLLHDGLAGGLGTATPSGFQLTAVTALLEQIGAQLQVVNGELGARLPAGSPLVPLLALVDQTLVNATLALDRLAALDGEGIADTLAFLPTDVAAALSPTLASQLGIAPGLLTVPQYALMAALTSLQATTLSAAPALIEELEPTLVEQIGGLLGGVPGLG